MKCKFCFAELDEDVRTCPVCGKDLTQPEEEQPAEIIEETIEEVTEMLDNNNLNKKRLKQIFNNLSYVTGLDCNINVDFKYFEK